MGICNCSIFFLFYSCFATNLMRKRERASCFAKFVFLVYRDCCVALPGGVVSLSAACDCDISLLTNYFWVSFMRTTMALASLQI